MARLTDLISRPAFVFVLATAVVGWIGANSLAPALGRPPLDAAPFPWPQGAATLVSLFLVVLVLGAQKHEDEVEKRQEMLSLELAVLSEQKAAKIIRMLEEFRRDHPQMLNRDDREADVMAEPANPREVLELDQAGAEPDYRDKSAGAPVARLADRRVADLSGPERISARA